MSNLHSDERPTPALALNVAVDPADFWQCLFAVAFGSVVSLLVIFVPVGIGVRVIADGTWGFAATSDVSPDSIAATARKAVAVAKANAKFQTSPVQLAPVKGVGDVESLHGGFGPVDRMCDNTCFMMRIPSGNAST